MLERMDLKTEKQSVLSEAGIMEVLQRVAQKTACCPSLLDPTLAVYLFEPVCQEHNYPDCSKDFGLSYQGVQVCIL
jgi:hypothetical protein